MEIKSLDNTLFSYTKDPKNSTLEIMDETHYYPFGLQHAVYVPDSRKVIVGNKEDRMQIIEYLSNIYGENNFSFNDDNELKFIGNKKDFKRDAKDTLGVLNDLIEADYEVNVKLSGFDDNQNVNLDKYSGAYTEIMEDGGANIYLDINRLANIPLYGSAVHSYLDSNGILQSTKDPKEIPSNTKFVTNYPFQLDNNGNVMMVPSGGGSVGIMHEFFHVKFEGKNQKKVNQYDNKIRRILNIPERSVNDPKH